MQKVPKVKSAILDAVANGLSQNPKKLPSWLFYNEKGDQIFQSITKLDEYYPTKAEFEILEKYRKELIRYFSYSHNHFDLIELGPGDGMKTEILLSRLTEAAIPFTYKPIDISENVLFQLQDTLKSKFPSLRMEPAVGKYEDALKRLTDDEEQKVILFLGANIGNYSLGDAQAFLNMMGDSISIADLVLLGFDLKKNPRTVAAAYDDARGVTAEFNLNLLHRLNEELGATFDVNNFIHYPLYDPVSGEARSYLVSIKPQSVYVHSLQKVFTFSAWEAIHTEVSQKYDMRMIKEMSGAAGLEIIATFFDSKQYFCDVLFRKK
jgi:L-histidine Nalpha-methyltransferase